jgi:hypothetical protein
VDMSWSGRRLPVASGLADEGRTTEVRGRMGEPNRPCGFRCSSLLAGAVDGRLLLPSFEDGVVKVTAVRIRYEHIAAGWRRATAERRTGLLGELELLALQLPEVQSLDDPDRAEVVALLQRLPEGIRCAVHVRSGPVQPDRQDLRESF